MRVVLSAGSGNAFATFRQWTESRRETSAIVTHSRLMYEACARHGVAARIICTYGGDDECGEEHCGDISVIRRPDPMLGKGGIAYQRGIFEKAHTMIRDALDFGADLAIVSESTSPILFGALRRRGVRIAQTLHTRPLGGDHTLSMLQRLRLRGYGLSYGSGNTAVISSSRAITNQVRRLAGNRKTPIVEFLPLHHAEHYAGLSEPDWSAQTLDVAFVDRSDENEDVLDLVEIARVLADRGIAIRFHVCGTSTSIEIAKHLADVAGLGDSFVFHGAGSPDILRRVLGLCQLSIVPARGDFVYGIGPMVIESILAGRPVVASRICPVVNYVGDAIATVPVGDVARYAAALTELARNRTRLMQMAAACPAMGRRFLDPDCSFGTALDEVFTAVRERRPVRDRLIDPVDARLVAA